MSLGHTSFYWETDYRQGFPQAPQAWTDVILVGIDAFAPFDRHGTNISIISKSELMWFNQ
jgi:hypothetical protein